MAEEGRMSARFSRGGHELVLEADAAALERQRKVARTTLVHPPATTFEIYCDEGPYLDGDDTAPPPLAYLTSAVAF
jgi:hypothetical protein